MVSESVESANVPKALDESETFRHRCGLHAMTTKASALPLPPPNLGCLQALCLADLAVAYIGAQKSGLPRADATKALAEFGDADQALAQALGQGRIREQGGVYYNAQIPALNGSARSNSSASWSDVKRAFALSAVGSDQSAANGKRARKDLGAVALRQLYALDNLSPFPSRAEVRCELLHRIVAAFGEPFATSVLRPAKPFKLDPLSHRLYLAFAGLESGTVLQADAALLSFAFGGSAATVADLSATIVRAALKAQVAGAQEREEAFNLDGFAESVRELARKLETKPYAGRVAIAQVYDAGLEEGLDLGTLDDFKMHLAEAAREGLLDLERYDITGSLDAGLKERSRLRLGRDERHFIVNQWI
jgi:hypothetical protein